MKLSILTKIKLVVVGLSGFMLFISLTSCKQSAEKTVEKAIEKSIGKDADVDAKDQKIKIETDDGSITVDGTKHKWPSEIPSDFPEFEEGKIISVMTYDMDDGKNWTIMYEEVPDDAYDKYKKELQAKGFKIEASITAGEGNHLTASKEDYFVTVMSGEGMATVGVVREK